VGEEGLGSADRCCVCSATVCIASYMHSTQLDHVMHSYIVTWNSRRGSSIKAPDTLRTQYCPNTVLTSCILVVRINFIIQTQTYNY
jgi:hypothetical protein